MPAKIKLFIVDAAPLINLAAANSLDYLFYADMPVIIPDAVFYEATRISTKIGAQEIIEWQRANSGKIIIEATSILQNELVLSALPDYKPASDLGERATNEILRDKNVLAENERAIFLTDDSRAWRVIEEEKTVFLTTLNYLQQLEKAQRIQSADYIFKAIKKTGQNPPSHDMFASHDPEIRDAVMDILKIKDPAGERRMERKNEADGNQ